MEMCSPSRINVPGVSTVRNCEETSLTAVKMESSVSQPETGDGMRNTTGSEKAMSNYGEEDRSESAETEPSNNTSGM